MSEPISATAESSPPPFIIVRMIADYVCAIEALAATSVDSLDHATLCSSYENAINLPCILYSSENLTNQFAALVTENEDLMLECDAANINRNMLTAQVMQLEAQLMQTLTLMATATNSLPATYKG
jgi:hypothetical protein